jgi:hypothetical protein
VSKEAEVAFIRLILPGLETAAVIVPL